MSYLELYDTSKVADRAEVDNSASVGELAPPPIQAKFVRQNLTDKLAQSILDYLPEVQAINLSKNNLTVFPSKTSPNLIALNVSHNHIAIPVALSATFMLIELNLCNNKITDLRGLSMLTSVQYLDVSENLLSAVDGLENMKALKVLKLAFNRISNFQGLRLLTYNSALHDIWLEGNPIEQDVYYKVKLLKYVPHLKTLDGMTVWRRTALQSTIVNDDLKYSDLCLRTPGTVVKYAKLSRRSASQLVNDSILNNFSSSMLTMQSLQMSATTPQNPNNSSLHHTTNSRAPQSQYQLRRLHDVIGTEESDASYSVAARSKSRPGSPKRSRNSASDADLALLPPQLRAQLMRLRQASDLGNSSPSPRNPKAATSPVMRDKNQEKSIVGPSTGTAERSLVQQGSAPERPRSSLPWRKPPSIVPNLELSNRRKRTGIEPSTNASGAVQNRTNSASGENSSRGGADAKPPRLEKDAAQKGSHRESTAAAAQRANPDLSLEITTALPSPQSHMQPRSPSASFTTVDRWMIPELNQDETNRTPNELLSIPTPSRFDSGIMEHAIHSSMQILQKSFEADRRASLKKESGNGSDSVRGRSRSRDPGTPRGSSRGGASVASSGSPSRRSVSQTRSSTGRMSYTNEMLRAQEQEERVAKDLIENHTYSRPTSPARFPRSPGYSVRDGANMHSSPCDSENNSTVITLTSSRLGRAFSPVRSQAGSRVNLSNMSVNSTSTSPSRLTSTERILQHYNSRMQSEPRLVLPSAAPRLTIPRPESAHHVHAHRYSEESKAISPVDSVVKTAPPQAVPAPAPAPVPVASAAEKLDESPYRRFLKLRERLSNKYMNGEEEHADVRQQENASAVPHNGAHTHAHHHTYDYVRSMNVDKVDRMLNPSVQSLDARDIGEIESKIVELQEQDLQFHQLKEQYQRQYQEQYEKQKRDQDAKFSSSKAPVPAPPPASTLAPTKNSAGNNAVVATPVSAVPPPPLTGGYDVLYDLIQRRRSVLEHIASPSDISPEKSRAPPDTGAGSSKGIFNAISDLKQRQSASVNVIQSMTRERALPPGPVRDSLAQVALATPALHSSISNYLTMANSPPLSQVPVASGQNGFMARLTSNNPYMQAPSSAVQSTTAAQSWAQGRVPFGLSNTSMTPAPPAPLPYVPYYQPAPYVPADRLPPQRERSVSPKNRSNGPATHVSSTTNQARSPRASSPMSGKRGMNGTNLSSMIQGLHAKQTKDLRRLSSF